MSNHNDFKQIMENFRNSQLIREEPEERTPSESELEDAANTMGPTPQVRQMTGEAMVWGDRPTDTFARAVATLQASILPYAEGGTMKNPRFGKLVDIDTGNGETMPCFKYRGKWTCFVDGKMGPITRMVLRSSRGYMGGVESVVWDGQLGLTAKIGTSSSAVSVTDRSVYRVKFGRG